MDYNINVNDNNYTIEIVNDMDYNITIDKDGFIGATNWGTIVGDIDNQVDLKNKLDSKENLSNKSNVLSTSSTDEQYPTSKIVYDTISDLRETVTDDISNLADFETYANDTFETKTSHNSDMNTKADKFTVNVPLEYTNNNIKLNVDNQLLQINTNNELTVNLDEIGSELTDKLNTDLSNITEAGKEIIVDTIPNATIQKVGLVKPDNSTITIDTDGTIHSLGGGGGEDKYGIKGDYSTHYGILDCPNGLIDIVSGKTIRINAGIMLQCAGQDSKTTIGSSFTQELESTGDIVLFYAGGSLLECGDVFYQETEPDDGVSNYVAWYKPSVNTWYFKSNDTGNVFRSAVATPLANIRLTSSNITRIDYIGYRILDDEIFTLKSDFDNQKNITVIHYGSQGSDARPVYIDANGVAQTCRYDVSSVGANNIYGAKLYIVGSPFQDTNSDSYTNELNYIDSSNIINTVTPDVNDNSTRCATTNFLNQACDGQWVAKFSKLSGASAVGDYTISLSSYLPNDNYQYEVMFAISTRQKNNSNTSHAFLSTDIIPKVTNDVFSLLIVNANGYYQSLYVTMPVGSGRYCKFSIFDNPMDNSGARGLAALAYRRIGTNT